ncbi:STAS domain-containing protein [Streptomyces massasporeus]|uniref:STAS domain-containing protein n=1 Tax=Streptomyces massasporeus TaxID=67324 RepID=UPI0036B7F6F2
MTHEHARTGPIRSECIVGDTTVLELHGDLDIAVTPIVTARLDALTAHPHPDLVVDLCPVPFLGCAAPGAQSRTRVRSRERQGRLRVVCDSDRLRSIVRRTGLADAFEVYRSLTDALSPKPREYRPAVTACADRPGGRFSCRCFR